MNNYSVNDLHQTAQYGNNRNVQNLSHFTERYIKGDLDAAMVVRIVREANAKQFHAFVEVSPGWSAADNKTASIGAAGESQIPHPGADRDKFPMMDYFQAGRRLPG